MSLEMKLLRVAFPLITFNTFITKLLEHTFALMCASSCYTSPIDCFCIMCIIMFIVKNERLNYIPNSVTHALEIRCPTTKERRTGKVTHGTKLNVSNRPRYDVAATLSTGPKITYPADQGTTSRQRGPLDLK